MCLLGLFAKLISFIHRNQDALLAEAQGPDERVVQASAVHLRNGDNPEAVDGKVDIVVAAADVDDVKVADVVALHRRVAVAAAVGRQRRDRLGGQVDAGAEEVLRPGGGFEAASGKPDRSFSSRRQTRHFRAGTERQTGSCQSPASLWPLF